MNFFSLLLTVTLVIFVFKFFRLRTSKKEEVEYLQQQIEDLKDQMKKPFEVKVRLQGQFKDCFAIVMMDRTGRVTVPHPNRRHIYRIGEPAVLGAPDWRHVTGVNKHNQLEIIMLGEIYHEHL